MTMMMMMIPDEKGSTITIAPVIGGVGHIIA